MVLTTERPRRSRPPTRLTPRERRARLLVCAAIAGSAFLGLSLPLNLAPGDIFLVLLVVLGVAALTQGEGGPFGAVLFQSAPFLWLLTLASLTSLWGVGITGWAIDHTLRDLLSLTSFALIGAYLWSRRRVIDHVLVVYAAIGVVVALSALLGSGSGLRQAGALFRNPNYTAHFIAVAIVVTAYSRLRKGLKLTAIAIMLMGMLPTGSFGGAAVVCGSALVIPFRSLRVLEPGLRAVARLMLLLVMAGLLYAGATAFQTSEVDLGKGASAVRFDKSSDSRLVIWRNALGQLPTHPMGVGQGGIAKRTDIVITSKFESHNDYVAFLVETGVLGLVAFLGIGLVIWRSLPPGGGARVLFVGVAFGACFREVVNFRHLWLGLILLALRDYNERDGRLSEDPLKATETPVSGSG